MYPNLPTNFVWNLLGNHDDFWRSSTEDGTTEEPMPPAFLNEFTTPPYLNSTQFQDLFRAGLLGGSQVGAKKLFETVKPLADRDEQARSNARRADAAYLAKAKVRLVTTLGGPSRRTPALNDPETIDWTAG